MGQLEQFHKLGQSTAHPHSATGASNLVAPSAPINLVQLSTIYQAGLETTCLDLDANIRKMACLARSELTYIELFPFRHGGDLLRSLGTLK